MSKVKKMKSENLSISKEQLKKVQGLQADLQKYCAHIGGLEVQKAKAIYQVNMLEKELDEFKATIEEEYGPINIDLTNGSYEKIAPVDKD